VGARGLEDCLVGDDRALLLSVGARPEDEADVGHGVVFEKRAADLVEAGDPTLVEQRVRVVKRVVDDAADDERVLNWMEYRMSFEGEERGRKRDEPISAPPSCRSRRPNARRTEPIPKTRRKSCLSRHTVSRLLRREN
jgi:hypothetical protein